MITGIYVRVSTEEQVTGGYSIRAQEEKLKDYAKVKDWIVYKIYIDEGISGKNITERPAANEMIQDIMNHKIDNVVVYKIDRLTRSIVDLIHFVEIFAKYDCTFNSLTESIDTQTAAGRMFLKIIGIFAEFERENIIERTKLGFERKAKEGYSLCTRTASYGYTRENNNKIQQIVEEEAEIVKYVFDMFIKKNMSCFEIAFLLNMKQIPTKENSKWHARTVKNMLTNCNYIGYVRYATKDKKRNFEVKGLHEPIIEEDTYQAAQELISNIKVKQYTKRPKEEHFFLGVLYCGVCGDKMTTHGSYVNKVFTGGAYRCRNKIKKICDSSMISHKKMENTFIDYIGHIDDFDVLNEIELSEQKEGTQSKIFELESYKNKYEQLLAKENELSQHYINGTIDLDNYMFLKKALEKEKDNITSELEKLEVNTDEKTEIQRADIIKNLRENWTMLDNAEKRQFVLAFIDKIVIVNEPVAETGKRLAKILSVEFKKT